MPVYLAIFLGLVQGLTEFLPVSSSGHLLLIQHLFNMPENMLMFNIILHLATLAAVVIVFHKKIWYLIKNPFCKTNIALLISTVITCVMVVLFKDTIDRAFTYKILPFTFMTTAIILLIPTLVQNTAKQSAGVTPVTGIVTGLAQTVAIMPGISRSGATISAALASGIQREQAAEFSFLMSIPIIIASFLYEIVSAKETLQLEILPTTLAFATALASGVFAIKFMLVIVKKIKLYWFSLYLILLSVSLLILF